MENTSMDDFEKDAIQYLDKIGRRHLNIVNNVLMNVKKAYENKRCTYPDYIEAFRVVMHVKQTLLDKGRITATDMGALNDISLSFSERI